MENFCKGVVFGMLAGACVGAIVVAKNKKLSNKIKEGLVTAEGKIKEIKDSLEDKMNDCACGQDSGCASRNYDNCYSDNSERNTDLVKNNFSKKNKND